MGWRSATLPWIVLGAIVGGGALIDMRDREHRNFYRSREDCERDYNAEQCHSGYHTTGGYAGYHGPYYRGAQASAENPGAGRTAVDGHSVAAHSTESVRGGFGGSARAGRGGYHVSS